MFLPDFLVLVSLTATAEEIILGSSGFSVSYFCTEGKYFMSSEVGKTIVVKESFTKALRWNRD